ncbi:hypothetical protein [Dyadobacter sp. NIV53]|uniref:hypothetical protein n=1 Tax=Dyadobacter sp. NIV53 TaxID=2861765 RepID=UPI001C882148|nr:hypothetical protein [Dyadobacter sp. NIV53]
MNSDNKAQIYRDKFPSLISERMAAQVDIRYKVRRDYSRYNLVIFAFDWAETKEGNRFWSDIRKLYGRNENASEDHIAEVFRKHNIDLPVMLRMANNDFIQLNFIGK